MKKNVYITTPIYYSSGNVHIGNSYSTIVCDVFARYNRLIGNDTFYLTGMDEHGQKIEEKAKSLGKTPQELVDEVAINTKKLWENLKITNNDFIRTSEERHFQIVQTLFEKLLAKDDIYLDEYVGDYCLYDESFFTKTQMKEEGICPECHRETIKVKEEAYFLRLKKYEARLLKFIEDHPDFIQPETRRNEVVSFIKQGLEDLCVSRTSFTWGIPVLSNPRHVVYVWIDALTNYISALGYGTKDDAKFKKYWLDGEVYHVVGKDILRFHAVYWPIMLMALEIPITFKLYAHGWLLSKEGQMRKSFNNVVYPMDVVNSYGLDALRYFLVSQMPLGSDAIFSYDRFLEKFNVDLANDLGNLVSRSISMINKYQSGKVTKPNKTYSEFDVDVEKSMDKTIGKYHENFSNFLFQNGIIEVWNLIRRANKYIDETTPWAVAKDEARKEELNSILYHLYEVIRNVAMMINPVMPDASKIILEELGIQELDFSELKYGVKDEAFVTEKPIILFKRIDIEEELKKYA